MLIAPAPKTLHKGQVVQRPGDTRSKVYVVKKGLLRSYAVDEKGKEYTFLFAPEGWVIGDAMAHGDPAMLYIEALEDSQVQVLPKDVSREAQHVEPLLRRMAVLQKRILMLMSADALARYRHFLETYPDIVQRVPQRMVASYLGITPEALSKLKREL